MYACCLGKWTISFIIGNEQIFQKIIREVVTIYVWDSSTKNARKEEKLCNFSSLVYYMLYLV